MTTAEIREIKQRAEKLDKGKWKAEITYSDDPGYEEFIKGVEIVHKNMCIARMDWSNPPIEYAEFIAHARQDIPNLLAHITELTGKAEELEAEKVALKQIMTDPENQPNQFCPQSNCLTVRELTSANEKLKHRASQREAIQKYDRLKSALYDAINSPKGIVPDSALPFYDSKEATENERT